MSRNDYIEDFKQKVYDYEHAMCDGDDTPEQREEAYNKWQYYKGLVELLEVGRLDEFIEKAEEERDELYNLEDDYELGERAGYNDCIVLANKLKAGDKASTKYKSYEQWRKE